MLLLKFKKIRALIKVVPSVWKPTKAMRWVVLMFVGVLEDRRQRDYSTQKTWDYMLGGALVGGVSGGVGAYISSSGVAFANTLSILGGSLTNSVGMNLVTNGQTPISISLGFASFNFRTNDLGYFGKKGNEWYENLGYGMGALANIADFLAMGGQKGQVDLVTEHSDATGHSAIIEPGASCGETCGNIVSFGPKDSRYVRVGLKSPDGDIGSNWRNHTTDKSPLWRTTIKDVNVTKLREYGNNLFRKNTHYNIYFSNCVTHTSRALNSVGVFNIGIHPYLLSLQMGLRAGGFRPFLSSYLLLNN